MIVSVWRSRLWLLMVLGSKSENYSNRMAQVIVAVMALVPKICRSYHILCRYDNYSYPYHISLLSPLFSNNHFIPNLIGCYIISILYHNKNNITKKYGNALYVGMCTGLCGCVTTFSSWIYESAEDMFVINVLTTIIIMVSKILILICVIVVLILIYTFVSYEYLFILL